MSSTILEIGLSNAVLATVLAIVAFAVTRRMRPQWALAVWLLVLVKLLMPPLWTLPLGSLRSLVPIEEPAEFVAWPEFSAWPVDNRNALVPPESLLPSPELVGLIPAAQEIHEPSQPRVTLPTVILLAWVAGTLLWSALVARRILRFNRLLKQTRLAPAGLQVEVAHLAREMGLHRVPLLRITHRRIAPLVWAFGRIRTILLPAALLETLTINERKALLLHELSHLRRRDYLTTLIELAAVGIYWWLPTAWWARRQADSATEGCCDAEVVAHLAEGSRSYASALVKTIDFLSGPAEPLPLGASGFSQFRHVSRRIEMILEPIPVSRSLWRHRLALLAVGAAVLPLSLSSLWAEPPADEVDGQAALPSSEETTASPAGVPSDLMPITSSAERATQYQADLAIEHEGPVEYEENPQTKVIFPSEIQLSAEDQAHYTAQMNTFLKKYFAKRSLQEAAEELAHLEQKATTTRQLKMVRLRDHLRLHLAAIEKKFADGDVPIDTLIAVQQQFADAEAAVARAVCPRDWSGEVLRMQASYMIACEALNRARKTWQQVYKQNRASGAEPATEALAREHFYQCKQKCQNVFQAASGDFGQLVSQAGPDRDMEREQSAAMGAEWRMFAIAGAVTTGPQIGAIEPPSDEELLKSLTRKLFADGRSPVEGNVHIVRELRATYADEPRAYSEVGEVQRHHAIYKVTVAYIEKGGKQTVEVVYVDHQHLHRFADSVTQSPPAEAQGEKPKASPTEPARTGDEFEPSEDQGEGGNLSEGVLIDRDAFQAKMKSLADDAKVSSRIVDANAKRCEAAAHHVTAMEVAFNAGTVTIDQLLEAQRRHADARAVYYKTILQSDSDSDDHRLLLHKANVVVSQDAMNSARRTWQKLYAKYRKNTSGGEAANEAQAREQFYQFKSQFERVRGNYEWELKRQEADLQETSSVSENQPNVKQMDSASPDEIQSGPFRFSLPRGVRKQGVTLVHEKENLAKEIEAAVRRLETQAALDRSIEFFVGPWH